MAPILSQRAEVKLRPARGGRLRGRWLGPPLALCATLVACPVLAQAGSGAGAQRGRAAGPAAGAELAVVARFDRNGDERLDRAERVEARAWLASYRPGGVSGQGSAGLAPTSPGARIAPSDVRSFSGEHLYDPKTLRTLFIDFESSEWEQELAAFYDTDVEVPAVVTVDGRRYPDVGVGFRGATSFLGVPSGSKRSLNLSFDFVDEDQRIGGYRTLNLLNGHNDPTFVRGVLYSEIARRYIPAPQVNFVRVVINGESWGVYASAQQFNKDFLRDFFGDTDGARWKVAGVQSGRAGLEYLGEDEAAYRRYYEIRSDDDPERWRDLIRLTRVLNETPPARLEAELAPLLDIDGTLRFLALEVALVNVDGYWARASDYSLYQDPGGRFHVIPHDINEALGAETFGTNDGPRLDPLVGRDDARRPLRSRLMAVPALRERYLSYVRDIATRWLDWRVLGPLVEEHRALIAEDVRRDTRKLYGDQAFAEGFGKIGHFVEARRAFLLAEGMSWRGQAPTAAPRLRDSARAAGIVRVDAGQRNRYMPACVTKSQGGATERPRNLVLVERAFHLLRRCS